MRALTRRLVAAAGLCHGMAASAGEALDFEFGRYLVKYPGLYATVLVSDDPRDASFDADGAERDSALPAYGDGVALGETRLQTTLEWTFPWFEAARIPLVSRRLWMGRASFGYASLDTGGAVRDEVRERGLVYAGEGITDVILEFGPVLHGSRDWRRRTATPLSVLLLGHALLPVGERSADAPNNAGINVPAYGAELGLHARPGWGLLADAGLRWRAFLHNAEPAFGGHEPARRGDELVFNATFARALLRDFYLALSWRESRGQPNEYENPRFAVGEPQAGPGTESVPVPGTYRDDGTRLSELGLSLHWFATQRLRLGLHYVEPLAGESGSFELPYRLRLEDCEAINSCDPKPNGSARVDGLDGARRFASERLMLSLLWQFGQGDAWWRP